MIRTKRPQELLFIDTSYTTFVWIQPRVANDEVELLTETENSCSRQELCVKIGLTMK